MVIAYIVAFVITLLASAGGFVVLAFHTNWIYRVVVAEVALLYVAIMILSILATMKKCKAKDINISKDIYRKVEKEEIMRAQNIKNIWKRNNVLWDITYFFLHSFSIFLSILVVYIANHSGANSGSVIIFSTASICSTTCSFILRPKEQAYGYRIAFVNIDDKLNRFYHNECTWEAVLDAIRDGEKTISSSTYDSLPNSKE